MARSIQDHLSQFKTELQNYLKKQLVEGDTWFLIESYWFHLCKRYIAFDGDEGYDEANPGPIDNIALMKDDDSDEIRDDMIDGMDYKLVPSEAWDLLVEKFTLEPGQQPIARKVIEQGSGLLKVEIHLLKLELTEYSHQEIIVNKKFSRSDTVDSIETVMRTEFNIDDETTTRLYTKYGLKPLVNYEIPIYGTLGLWSGQRIIIEKMNDDGSWPRQKGSQNSKRQRIVQGSTSLVVVVQHDQLPKSLERESHDRPSMEIKRARYETSAENVKVDLEQTNEELVQKLTTKIDDLNSRRIEQDLIETAERENLEKRFKETINDQTSKKEKHIKVLFYQEEKEMEELKRMHKNIKDNFLIESKRKDEVERSKFIADKKLLSETQNATRASIEHAVKELTKKLDTFTNEEENTELKQEMECPICLEQMKPPTRIIQCTSGHLLCEGCKNKMKAVKCPTCKEAKIMGRATAMEQMARALFLKKD